MANVLVENQSLSDIADAIRTKLGVQSTYKPGQMAAAIANIPSGGGAAVSESDVNFFDYDGTIVASYTASDFANLSALPANPTHQGLTAQGWNWTLADAKAYVASYGKLNVGQMYVTSDGKTRIYIRLEEGRLAPYLGMGVNGTATIDWGDGTSNTVTGYITSTIINTQHTYSHAGDYVIAISVSGNGSIMFFGDSSVRSKVLWKNTSAPTNSNYVYRNSILKVEFGDNVGAIGDYAFHNCQSLKSVSIPHSINSIRRNAFYQCFSLEFISIPDSVTTISDSVFAYCPSLASVSIPNSVTSIGESAFYDCRSLRSPIIPSSVQSIGASAFSTCYSLASFIIPYGVTSIAGNAFYDCSALASVEIPDGVASIGNGAFRYGYGLGFIKFLSDTPPSVSNNTWNGLSTDCIIYVPQGSLSAYTSAQYYPSSATYSYVEY